LRFGAEAWGLRPGALPRTSHGCGPLGALVRRAELPPSREAPADPPKPCPPSREALRRDLDGARRAESGQRRSVRPHVTAVAQGFPGPRSHAGSPVSRPAQDRSARGPTNAARKTAPPAVPRIHLPDGGRVDKKRSACRFDPAQTLTVDCPRHSASANGNCGRHPGPQLTPAAYPRHFPTTGPLPIRGRRSSGTAQPSVPMALDRR